MNPIVKDKVKKTPKGKYIPKKSLGRVDNAYEHNKEQDLKISFD